MMKRLPILSRIVLLIALMALSGIEKTYGADISDSFTYPMDPYVEGHRYYNEWTDVFGGKYHAAQDCQGKGGDPVYAVANGVVSYSYGEGGEWAWYGYLITIDHQLPDGSRVYSLYGHLSTRRWKKLEGEVVHKGDLIGYLGDDDEDGNLTGWGPHLHFGIRMGKKSDYYDFLVGYYPDHPALHGWIDPGNFIESNLRSAGFPDLTGQWNSLAQSCRATAGKLRCKLQGALNIQNRGDQKALASAVSLYLSLNETLDENAVFLKKLNVGSLKAGAGKVIKWTYNLPINDQAAGKHVIAVIDEDMLIAESDENNNATAGGPIL
jgi:murein DD-endopeptidase MepM/ murein hydrolase activator NlpD